MAMSRTQKWVITGAAGVGALLGTAGIANAATGGPAPSTAPAAAVQDAPGHDGADKETAPTYTSSITIPDTGAESTDDSAEAATLASLAVLTPDEATAAAVAAVPGTAAPAELENENGNVVYSVQVTTAAGQVDVKVDAGNGSILAQESDVESGDGETADGQKDSGHEAGDAADAETNDGAPGPTVTGP